MATLVTWHLAQQQGIQGKRANGGFNGRRIKKHKPYHSPSPCIIKYDLQGQEDRTVKQHSETLRPLPGIRCKLYANK